MLYDFHARARDFTSEGVAGLAQEVLARFRSFRRIDQFGFCIGRARENDIFKDKHGLIYDELEKLQKLRNRIHIQNEKQELEPDEINVYTEARKTNAECALETVAPAAHALPSPA
jgi:hypothetical protein